MLFAGGFSAIEKLRGNLHCDIQGKPRLGLPTFVGSAHPETSIIVPFDDDGGSAIVMEKNNPVEHLHFYSFQKWILRLISCAQSRRAPSRNPHATQKRNARMVILSLIGCARCSRPATRLALITWRNIRICLPDTYSTSRNTQALISNLREGWIGIVAPNGSAWCPLSVTRYPPDFLECFRALISQRGPGYLQRARLMPRTRGSEDDSSRRPSALFRFPFRFLFSYMGGT